MVKFKNLPYYQYEEYKYQITILSGAPTHYNWNYCKTKVIYSCKMRNFIMPWKNKIGMHFKTSDIMSTFFFYSYLYLYLKLKH